MEALDLQEDCKHSNKDKQMSTGRKKFNMDPKKGTYNPFHSLLRKFPVFGVNLIYDTVLCNYVKNADNLMSYARIEFTFGRNVFYDELNSVSIEC